MVPAGQSVVDVDQVRGDAEGGEAGRWEVRSCSLVETRA